MWESQTELLAGGQTRRVSILDQGEPLRYSEVIGLWQREAAFRVYFDTLLREAPFTAYFWETPPVTTADRPFEFVLVDGPYLAEIQPDPHAFEKQFALEQINPGVVSFSNLGGDAVLVAPCPLGELSAYPHLAAFVRTAPEAQRQALWQTVGAVLEKHVGQRPTWLSTAGLGVSWLHIRLDSRPKYYRYRPYTLWSA